MYAILTKRLPVTATKPARIKAYTPDHSVIISWPMDTQTDRHAHAKAAVALVKRHSMISSEYGWHCGEIKGGYAFVASRPLSQP